MPAVEWIILTDRNIAIRFERHEYHIDFRAFDAAESQSCADGVWTEKKWELFDGGESWPLEEWEDAFWEIRGGLKWDGCINWETNPECMAHGCGPEYLGVLTDLFGTIYAYGKRHFDLLGAEVPPMPASAIEGFAGDPTGSTRRARARPPKAGAPKVPTFPGEENNRMTQTLKPCPFCGGEAKFNRIHSLIACTSCLAEGPVTTPEGLAHDWNMRAALPDPAADEEDALREAYSAMRWVYLNGMIPSPERPQWVSDAFDKAWESERKALATRPVEHGE